MSDLNINGESSEVFSHLQTNNLACQSPGYGQKTQDF